MLSGALVNKFGKKLLLLVSGVLTVAVTLWLRWASSKAEVVGLFAADMAIGQTMLSLLQVTIIEVFPTTTRLVIIDVIRVFSVETTILKSSLPTSNYKRLLSFLQYSLGTVRLWVLK